MKKITFLVAVFLFLGINTTKASDKKVLTDDERRAHTAANNYADPIVFMERGIEFYVFLNGEFDFNTVTRATTPVRNTTYGAPRSNSSAYYGPRNNGVIIQHDNLGRVRRVGNVFINYDHLGRVKRMGSVYMSYNNFGLSQIGGMRIIYNRRGQITRIIGSVNGYAYNNSYEDNHYQADGYNGNDTSEDYYYYREDGTKVKEEIKKEKD